MYMSLFCSLSKKKKRAYGDGEGKSSKSGGGGEKEGEKKLQKVTGSEEWSDPWARQTRSKYKKKKDGEVF